MLTSGWTQSGSVHHLECGIVAMVDCSCVNRTILKSITTNGSFLITSSPRMLYGLSSVAVGGFERGRGSDTAGDSPGT